MDDFFAWHDRVQIGERAWGLSAENAMTGTPALVDEAEALVARAGALGLWTDAAEA